jgi:hypothetical protein
MNNRIIITHALADSLLTTLYVILIGAFFINAQSIFGPVDPPLIPIAMLLLFVFSAALCGSLVFGTPILWYLDGKKKEAMKLLGYTLIFLFLVLIGVFALMFFLR